MHSNTKQSFTSYFPMMAHINSPINNVLTGWDFQPTLSPYYTTQGVAYLTANQHPEKLWEGLVRRATKYW